MRCSRKSSFYAMPIFPHLEKSLQSLIPIWARYCCVVYVANEEVQINYSYCKFLIISIRESSLANCFFFGEFDLCWFGLDSAGRPVLFWSCASVLAVSLIIRSICKCEVQNIYEVSTHWCALRTLSTFVVSTEKNRTSVPWVHFNFAQTWANSVAVYRDRFLSKFCWRFLS